MEFDRDEMSKKNNQKTINALSNAISMLEKSKESYSEDICELLNLMFQLM